MNIYRITIDELEKDFQGLMAISLVDFPAVEENFLKFRHEGAKPARLTLKADTDEHIITGVALLADTPIYRYSRELGEYYIVFEADTIKHLVQKYSRDGLLNVINLQHDEHTLSNDQCTMIESYFVNHERGIAPGEFASVPDGSWIVSYKVEDDALWEAIKASNGEEGGLNGFSVEIIADIEPKLKKQSEPTLDEIVADLVVDKFAVTKNEIREAVKAQKQLEIEVGDKTETVQIKEIGTKGNKTIVNAYLPEKNVWRTIPLNDITSVVVTNTPFVAWDYKAPGYDTIVKDTDIVVTYSVIASRETIEKAIDGQYFTMIKYDDETETAAKGFRQVLIAAYGTTLAGNECFRAYEYSGVSSSDLPGGTGNWRLFLTRRCTFMRIMTEFERWSNTPPGYRTGDVDMTTIYKEIIPGDVNPYPNSVTAR